MNDETNYGLEEAGMAQLDDSVGALMKALDDMGVANNTIVIFTTDNGAEVFTWPDGEFYDQPTGWTGPKVTLDWPKLYNIRQDPFERVPIQNIAGAHLRSLTSSTVAKFGGLSVSRNSSPSSGTPPSIFRRCKRPRPLICRRSRGKPRRLSKRIKATKRIDSVCQRPVVKRD